MYNFKKNINIYKDNLLQNFDTADYHQYMRFHDETKIHNKWFGVSLQYFENNKIFITNEVINLFHEAFKKFLHSPDIIGGKWLIQPFYYKKNAHWFNSNKKFPSLKLSELKKVFNNCKINYSFKGVLETNNEGLITIFDALMLYPILLTATDFEIFNLEKPFVVHLSQHYSIDIITTDQNIINNFISILEKDTFIIRKNF